MAAVQELLTRLERCLEADDLVGAVATREAIARQEPAGAAGAEALYRNALYRLFVGRDLPAALEGFEAAAALPHEPWAALARTGAALCLTRLGRRPLALFRLRQVGYVSDPSLASVTALGLLGILIEEEGRERELARVEREKERQLDQLTRAAEPATAAYAAYLLGREHLARGRKAAAGAALRRAVEGGEALLGTEAYRQACRLLREVQ